MKLCMMLYVLDQVVCALSVQGIRESSIVDATLSKVRLQQCIPCCISYLNEGLPPSACSNLYALPMLSDVVLALALSCFKGSIGHCWMCM